MINLYKILTYILLPFAAIFGLLTVVTFFIAIANPAMFLGVFMLAAVAIYVFCCLRFVRQGINLQRPLTSKLKDWIKVNAYVASPFAIMNLLQSVTIIGKPSLLQEIVKQMTEMQQKAGFPTQPAGTYDAMLMGLLYVMLLFSIALFVHIILTFALLKKYNDHFEPTQSSTTD